MALAAATRSSAGIDWPVLRVSSIFSVAIYEGAADAVANGPVTREEGACNHVGSVEQELSVVGIVQAVAGGGGQDADGQADYEQSTGKMNPQSPGWTKIYGLWPLASAGNSRVRVSVGHRRTEPLVCPRRVPLEKSIHGYGEKLGDEVIDPCQCSIHSVKLMIFTTCTHGSMVSELGMERAI
ncbi:hypothetical protein ACQ4PT_051359 [Festuca glaucescens]